MRKRKWKVVPPLWTGACLAIALAGCGGQQQAASPDASGTSATPTPAPAKPAEPIELHMFSSSGQNIEWWQNTYGKYLEPKFPNITFKVHFPSEMNITDYVSSRGPLDIVFGGYSTFYTSIINFNLQNDISDLIQKDKYDLSRFEPTVIDLQRQLANGGIYGIPAWVGTSGLYYNKDLFDKFGVAYPKDGMTWDQVYDLSLKLTRNDGGVQYYGFANDNATYLQVNQPSLDLVDPTALKTSFDTDPWKKVVDMLTKFMVVPGYDPAQATVSAFNTKGTVAMAMNYTGCCGFTPGDSVKNWGVVTVPTFPDLPNVGPQVFPNYFFMSSISKHREAAFEVMKFIASDEFQASLNGRGLATALKDPKIREGYGKDLPKYNGQNVTALFPKTYAKLSHITEYQVTAANQLNDAINQIIKGKDMNTALREAAEAADKKIETAKAAKK